LVKNKYNVRPYIIVTVAVAARAEELQSCRTPQKLKKKCLSF